MAYSFYRAITISHSEVSGGSDLTNFPMVFAGTYSYLATVANGGAVTSANGYDIIFAADSAGVTVLDFEIQMYNSTSESTGQVCFWIRIPTLSASVDTVIYILYGNSAITSSQANPTGVWDSNYLAVYHLGDGTTLSIADSTSNANNATNSSPVAVSANSSGEFDGCGLFGTFLSDDFFLTLPFSFGGTDLTLQAWVQPQFEYNQANTLATIIGELSGSGNEGAILCYTAGFGVQAYRMLGAYTSTLAAAVGTQYSNDTTFGKNVWQMIVGRIASQVPSIWQNGASIAASITNGSGTFETMTSNPRIGNSAGIVAAGATAAWAGLIQEVRVSNIARSDGWMATEFNNQSSPSSFYSVGSATGAQTVDPTAIPTGQSFGTTYIVVPGIGPGSIPSQQSFGTVEMLGGTITVSPSTAVSPRAVGTPNIAGPLTMSAVPSQQSFGNVVLDAVQTVDPTAIASLQSFGTPTVNFTKEVDPTAIPSGQTFGTVKMTGGEQFPYPTAIKTNQKFGYPTIEGGDPQLTVFVGGFAWQGTVLALGGSDTSAPVTYESANPPTITSQTLGRWTLQVDLFDYTGNYAVGVGQTIVLVENGLNLFAGCVQTVAYTRLMGTTKAIIYHVTATDKSGICDRRVVLPTTYPAGNDVAQTILSIMASSLNGEGIVATPQSVPQDGSLGTLPTDLVCNYETVTTDFNQLATYSGTIWYVDALGVLFFNSFTNLPAAPFNLSEAADGSDSSNNFRSLLVSLTNIGYANQIFAVSNQTVLPGSGSSGGGTGVGSNTETFVLVVGNTGVIVVSGRFVGVNVSMPIGALYSITVNGVIQDTIYNLAALPSPPNPAAETPPQYGPWYFLNAQGVGGGAATQIASTVTLPSGATVIINYTPATNNAATSLGEALEPIDPATGGTLGTCGSGIYQLAIQVQNVNSIANLNAIAAAELVKRGNSSIQITYQTDEPGLTPGMIQNVDIPLLYLNNVNFVITQLQGIAAPAPLKTASRFQWQVTAQTNTDLGNWFQWFATLLQNASNPLPIPRYEDASFALATGSNIAGGLQVSNPYPVKDTGQLLVEYAAAATPPIDQDLLIFFFVNGTRIPGEVTIPGGSSPNTSYAYQFPTTNPLYVFNTATEPDIITVGTSYNVTGPNPIPASNVTANLRWSF